MTIDELITAAKSKGPWIELYPGGWIRKMHEPEICPVAAVGGGRSEDAVTTATEKLGMTRTDAKMLQLARMSYLEQSEAPSWIAINGEPEPDRTAEAVRLAVENRLGRRHRPAP